jgi:hypothetical protein
VKIALPKASPLSPPRWALRPSCPPPDPAEAALLSIWDETLETAAAEAYARDYMGFGFTRWRK